MNLATRLRPSTREGLTLLPSTLAVLLAIGVATGPSADGVTPAAGTGSTAQAAETGLTSGAERIELHVGDQLATATLEDTAAAHRFASLLPLELTLHDPMGQAKSGRLPRPLEISGADRVLDPDLAAIYYWPPTGDIALFYEDLGHLVPAPGLVRLGTIDSGLDAIAAAGNRFTLRIDAG